MTPASPAPTRVHSLRFGALLLTEFLGVLNDNALRVGIQTYVLLNVVDPGSRAAWLAAAGLLFSVPFILFSGLAGWLADRYPKHRVIQALKAAEIAACGVLLFALASGDRNIVLAALALMGLQSALFSPAKYGILPEILSDRELSLGNGWVNLTTFSAMAGGGGLGLLAAAWASEPRPAAALPFLLLALIGAGAACFIPRSESANPGLPRASNPLRLHVQDFHRMKAIAPLPPAMLGTAFFYFMATLFQMGLLLDLHTRFALGSPGAAALMGALTLGVAVGSYLAGRWSDEKVELGLVPLGALVLSAFALLLAVSPAEPALAAVELFAVGLGAGFFVVPLVSLIQQKSPRESRGRMIAFSNVLNFSAITLAFVVFGLLAGLTPVRPRGLLLGVGVLGLAATLVALRALPLFFVRFTVWLMAHTIYRIRVEGREYIPRRGPALLIPNHVSWVDAIILSSTLQRFIRFMMFRPFYEFKPTHWFFREAHVIPVAKGDPPEKTEASLRQAARELAEGHLVLIFAEGKLTRTGDLSPFRRGYQRILEQLPEGVEVPIIPIGLRGLWGSVFSHEGGRFLWKWPRRIPYDVTVRYGAPLPASTSPETLQEAVLALLESGPTDNSPGAP